MPPTPPTQPLRPTPPTPTLETERLRLDPLRAEDAEAMAGVLSDPEIYRFIGGGPPTADELRELYGRWVAGPPRQGDAWHNWAVRLAAEGTPVGHLQATLLDNGAVADIAWILGTPWQGRGYATEAAIELIRWLEGHGVATITAHVHPRHGASARVAERAGLEPTDMVEGGETVWRRVATDGRSRET